MNICRKLGEIVDSILYTKHSCLGGLQHASNEFKLD